ncbi:bifunctional diaminohydroxyphosphoribosylaminopyrimidine deaminase/5-amino-6-(5-phosphoribosylamino)uracil reductase RibD [Aurantivibrio plasticivorans]
MKDLQPLKQTASDQTVLDTAMMARAIALAERGLYSTQPNPRVGCVIVRGDSVLAEGWHQRAGEAHAEVAAIRAANNAGVDITGATAYVSLEPCSFHGKTGPCADALIEAKLGRVIYGMLDPNPKVAGRGIERLEQAGIAVHGPVLEDAARALNPGFIKRMEQGLPYVRIKMAMSLDGRTAMASGESKWITSGQARADVQRLRARSSAVISGIETVLRDQARLTVRNDELGVSAEYAPSKQPLRVVLDSKARLPDDAPLLKEAGPVLWVSAGSTTIESERLADTECQHLNLDENGLGRIDLMRLLRLLAERECNEVMVEAGSTLTGQFVQLGLADELVVYMAPKLMGSRARPLFDLPLDTMAAQLTVQIQDIRAVGQDWRITATLDKDD